MTIYDVNIFYYVINKKGNEIMENLHLTELMIKERMLKQELQKEYIKIGIVVLLAALIVL